MSGISYQLQLQATTLSHKYNTPPKQQAWQGTRNGTRLPLRTIEYLKLELVKDCLFVHNKNVRALNQQSYKARLHIFIDMDTANGEQVGPSLLNISPIAQRKPCERNLISVATGTPFLTNSSSFLQQQDQHSSTSGMKLHHQSTP